MCKNIKNDLICRLRLVVLLQALFDFWLWIYFNIIRSFNVTVNLSLCKTIFPETSGSKVNRLLTATLQAELSECCPPVLPCLAQEAAPRPQPYRLRCPSALPFSVPRFLFPLFSRVLHLR